MFSTNLAEAAADCVGWVVIGVLIGRTGGVAVGVGCRTWWTIWVGVGRITTPELTGIVEGRTTVCWGWDATLTEGVETATVWAPPCCPGGPTRRIWYWPFSVLTRRWPGWPVGIPWPAWRPWRVERGTVIWAPGWPGRAPFWRMTRFCSPAPLDGTCNNQYLYKLEVNPFLNS